jgi:hypothetical protein
MGDCFTSETIDISTTHVILPDDNPYMTITLDFILALIYGWLVSPKNFRIKTSYLLMII